MTTVKELEQELNISRVSLYAILKRDWFDGHVTRGNKKTIMVDDIGVDILRDYYCKKNRRGTPRNNVMAEMNAEVNVTDPDASELYVIGILQGQLVKKDEQINSLLSIVLNQQKMHA